MRQYRDELDAAHRRIEQLQANADEAERILRESRPHPRWKAATLGLGLAIGLSIGSAVFAAFGGWLDRTVDPEPVPAPIVTAPEPYVPPAEPLESTRRIPELVDVDGDGVLDIVATLVGKNDHELRVRAIDGETFKTLWTAGPYPGTSAAPTTAALSMVVVGDRVVVADAGGTIHVLARANGAELTTYAIPLGGETCFAPNAGVQVGASDRRARARSSTSSAAACAQRPRTRGASSPR
jgi:hypothetical protein